MALLDIIKYKRKERKRTMIQMAEVIGVTARQYGRIESGQSRCSVQMLESICEDLGLSVLIVDSTALIINDGVKPSGYGATILKEPLKNNSATIRYRNFTVMKGKSFPAPGMVSGKVELEKPHNELEGE